MKITDAELMAWIQHYLWTFTRIGGVMMAAPVLGSKHIPRRIRIILSIILTLILAPLMTVAIATELFTASWWLTTVQQLALGVAIGFVLMIAFEAVVMAGEIISYGMGLSFAQLVDPVRGVSTPVIGQFLLVLTTLLFLSMNGHLLLIDILAQSFRTLPIGTNGVNMQHWGELIQWGSMIFSGGLRLALPIMIALLLVNMAFGVLSRATPSLNLMSVGLPISLIIGLLLMRYSIPQLQVVFSGFLDDAWNLIARLTTAT